MKTEHVTSLLKLVYRLGKGAIYGMLLVSLAINVYLLTQSGDFRAAMDRYQARVDSLQGRTVDLEAFLTQAQAEGEQNQAALGKAREENRRLVAELAAARTVRKRIPVAPVPTPDPETWPEAAAQALEDCTQNTDLLITQNIDLSGRLSSCHTSIQAEVQARKDLDRWARDGMLAVERAGKKRTARAAVTGGLVGLIVGGIVVGILAR